MAEDNGSPNLEIKQLLKRASQALYLQVLIQLSLPLQQLKSWCSKLHLEESNNSKKKSKESMILLALLRPLRVPHHT